MRGACIVHAVTVCLNGSPSRGVPCTSGPARSGTSERLRLAVGFGRPPGLEERNRPARISLRQEDRPHGPVSTEVARGFDRKERRMAARDDRIGGIRLGGILVLVGILVMIVWSLWLGCVIALIGLVAFGRSY